MTAELHNPGIAMRIPDASCEQLCHAVSTIPGVVISQRRRPFWTVSDGSAEFTLRGHTFLIEPDEFDGVYWIMSRAGEKAEAEMLEIQAAVER